jgi:hypothetical protein
MICWIVLVALGALIFASAVAANFIGEATKAYKKIEKK